MLDIATILGIFFGFTCLFIAVMADGGEFGLFLCIPAIVIVMGGTVAATCVHFSLAQVLRLSSFIKKTFAYRLPSEDEAIQQLMDCALVTRRDGTLALEGLLKNMKGMKDSFMMKGLRTVIDGVDPEHIREHLDREMENLKERHYEGKKMLEFMGSCCPAFGMVGTLVGLVQMFSHMESPEKIGKGMATALVCTFYGAFLANLFFIPLAGKLGMRSKREVFIKQMLTEGIIAIAAGENPGRVKDIMHSFVSEHRRSDIKPSENARKAA
jgi:chemotaxis protein MotA